MSANTLYVRKFDVVQTISAITAGAPILSKSLIRSNECPKLNGAVSSSLCLLQKRPSQKKPTTAPTRAPPVQDIDMASSDLCPNVKLPEKSANEPPILSPLIKIHK